MSDSPSDQNSLAWKLMAPQAQLLFLVGSAVLADTLSRLLPHDWFIYHPKYAGFATGGLFLAAIIAAWFGSYGSVSDWRSYLVDRFTELIAIGLGLTASPWMIIAFIANPMPITSAVKWSMITAVGYIIIAWSALWLVKTASRRRQGAKSKPPADSPRL